MSPSLPKLRTQLSQIESDTQEHWQKLASSYNQYIQQLVETLQQKGSYAVFQVCTQIYPEAFLKLGYQSRCDFQQSAVQMLANFSVELNQLLIKNGISLDPNPQDPDQESSVVSANLPGLDTDEGRQLIVFSNSDTTLEANSSPQATDKEIEADEDGGGEFPSVDALKSVLTEALEKEGLSLERLIPKILQIDSQSSQLIIKTPEDLLQWCQRLETILQRSLVILSMQLNRQLIEKKLIPENLPPKILEMALQSEDERLVPQHDKMPHIVNVLIETAQRSNKDDKREEDNDSRTNPVTETPQNTQPQEQDGNDAIEEDSPRLRGEISRLTALNFRLIDLEFKDVGLSMIRKQIRTQVRSLKKADQQYHRLDKQRLTAEAEQAWRSSWNANDISSSSTDQL